jgi:hypothetical protein
MTNAEQLSALERRLEGLRCEVAGLREREALRRELAGPQKAEDYETQARYLGNFQQKIAKERKGKNSNERQNETKS